MMGLYYEGVPLSVGGDEILFAELPEAVRVLLVREIFLHNVISLYGKRAGQSPAPTTHNLQMDIHP